MLILMALLAMGGTYLLVSALGTASSRTATERDTSARALGDARSALLGWVAKQALESAESNPGRLPCPESLADAGTGTASEGTAASFCTLPAAGRLPWKTLGLPRLVDSAGEPLWYVVGANWANYSAIASLVINSDTPGQLSVDGTANAAVALIIAPGAALSVPASANCTARTQTRQALPPDLRDYLECQNASSPADTTFATNGPSGSFNDQIVQIRTNDVMPVIEAAIAKRIERDVAPVLKGVYAGAEWGLSAANTVMPYAAPFADPGTSAYQGVGGQTQGLLPVSYYRTSPIPGCPTAPVDPRCTTTAIAWGAVGAAQTGGSATLWAPPSCSGSSSFGSCNGWYQNGDISIALSDPALNMASALRTFNTADHTVTVFGWRYTYNGFCGCWLTTPISATSTAVSRSFNSDGSVSFIASVALPFISSSDWGYFQIDAARPVFSDHAVLDSANATTGWFVRNEWHKFVYYAIAPSQAASGAAPRNCQDVGGNCLTVTNLAGANKRAVLVLGGRSLANAARPNANLTDYLENAENRNGDTTFTQDKVGPATNDRIVVLDQSS